MSQHSTIAVPGLCLNTELDGLTLHLVKSQSIDSYRSSVARMDRHQAGCFTAEIRFNSRAWWWHVTHCSGVWGMCSGHKHWDGKVEGSCFKSRLSCLKVKHWSPVLSHILLVLSPKGRIVSSTAAVVQWAKFISDFLTAENIQPACKNQVEDFTFGGDSF